jgi:hypothetical protein
MMQAKIIDTAVNSSVKKQLFLGGSCTTIQMAKNTSDIFDGRNLFDPSFVRPLGFGYLVIGC